MASFSFGAGNAGKLLRIPLYVFGRVVTALVPRSADLWVFGSAVGLADGAWALWREAAAQGERAVWLTGTDAEAALARERGIPSAPKSSWRGFALTARAAVIVVTHGFGDVNRYSATGGVVVQLWHGIPLKRIGLDAEVTTASPVPFARRGAVLLLRALYRRTQARIRVLPAASELVRGRLESAFGLETARVPVTGEPRTDVLRTGSDAERRAHGRAAVDTLVGPFASTTRLVLYAPTWRDGGADPAAPEPSDAARIEALLDETDAVLLIRSHHLGVGDYEALRGPRVRMLGSGVVADITPLLPGFDVLVTDYSSLAFDAALAELPTVFFAPDLEAYTASRGFYGTYAEVAGDDPARNWEGVTRALRAVLTDPGALADRLRRARALSAHVHAFRDGGSTARVYRVIRGLLRPAPAPERAP
ncbi:MAG: CDP-glycerol glycerophosphotransferase family protein [Microbacterium sp.]